MIELNTIYYGDMLRSRVISTKNCCSGGGEREEIYGLLIKSWYRSYRAITAPSVLWLLAGKFCFQIPSRADPLIASPQVGTHLVGVRIDGTTDWPSRKSIINWRRILNAEPAGQIGFCGQLIAVANWIECVRREGGRGAPLVLINWIKRIERLSAAWSWKSSILSDG